jgi:hypothetical protein
MDLRTHMTVIWRWRAIVGLGLVVAAALAFFSVARVSFAHGATYRQGETWQASEALLVNQPGGLYVTATLAPTSNPVWLVSLTSLYAQIANSAAIRTRVFPGGQATTATGDYVASQVLGQSGEPLAVLTFDGTGDSPRQAVTNAHRASVQFRSYVTAQAKSQSVSPKRSVVLDVLAMASTRNTKVVKGRKLTVPILVFLAVLIAALGLAYVLENLVPRKKVVVAPRPTVREARPPARGRERTLDPLSESVETTKRT